MTEQPDTRSVIAYRVRRAMGTDVPFVLVLRSGREVAGPLASCARDPGLVADLNPAGKTASSRKVITDALAADSRSNLVCTTRDGERVALDDVERVEYR